jgi:hypothetical protein
MLGVLHFNGCLDAAEMVQAPPTAPTEDRKTVAPKAGPPVLFWNGIRDRAYEKWSASGAPLGDCIQFWLEAEQELLSER